MASPTTMLFADYLRSWLCECAAERLSARSLERARSISEGSLIPALGGYLLSDLSRLHIQRYLSRGASRPGAATVALWPAPPCSST